MTPPHLSHRVLRRLVAAAVALLVLAGAATAQGAAKVKHESFSALQAQIAAGQVKQATVSKKKHVVTVKLKDGSKYKASYPAAADPTASLRAHGAHVRVKAAPASSHVRLRYIVLAVVAALAIAGGVAYLVRRRRTTGPGPAAPSAD
jgi:ATP-dependent Zn protease